MKQTILEGLVNQSKEPIRISLAYILQVISPYMVDSIIKTNHSHKALTENFQNI